MIIVGPDRCSEKTWKPPPCWDKILNLSPFISAKNFKWPPGGTCNKDTTGTSAQLSLAQLGGVFIVLVGGMVGITIIIIIIFLAQHDDVYIINRMVKTPIDCEKEFSLVNCKQLQKNIESGKHHHHEHHDDQVLAIIIAVCEFAWKRRKLLVDQNVCWIHKIFFVNWLSSKNPRFNPLAATCIYLRSLCCLRCGRS